MGAGDEVPEGLTQMGYKVTLVNAEEITTEKLEAFDVIMTEFAPIMFSHY
jgi:hypothetical protein